MSLLIKKFFSVLFVAMTLCTLALPFAYTSVFSQTKISDVVVFEKVNPDNPRSYRIKRLGEKLRVFSFLTNNKKRALYLATLTDKRLAELAYIVDKKDLANIETSSQRYEASVGNATELLVSKKLTNETPEFIEKLKKQQAVLDVLSTKFDYKTAEYRFVMNDVNSVKLYLDKLDK